MDDTPLFPFGFGLSYSHFVYSNVQIKKSTISKNEHLEIEVTIENTSDVDGKEIVQVYFNDIVAKVTRPVKELCAYKKIEIKAKSKVTVQFSIPAEQFSYLDAKMNHTLDAGNFALWVGPNSRDGIPTSFWIQ